MKQYLKLPTTLFVVGYYISALKLACMLVLLMVLCLTPTTEERAQREKIESENLGDIDNIYL
jgi:hypothetical protein